MDCQNERTNKTIIRVLGKYFNPLLELTPHPLLEHAPRQEWRGVGVVERGRGPPDGDSRGARPERGRVPLFPFVVSSFLYLI